MSITKPAFIESILLSYSRAVDEKTSVSILLSTMNEKLVDKKWNVKQAITCSTRLLVNRGPYWEEEYFDLYSLDDSCDLAQKGIHFSEKDVVLLLGTSINYNTSRQFVFTPYIYIV